MFVILVKILFTMHSIKSLGFIPAKSCAEEAISINISKRVLGTLSPCKSQFSSTSIPQESCLLCSQ